MTTIGTARWLSAAMAVVLAFAGPLALALAPTPVEAQAPAYPSSGAPAVGAEPTDGDKAGAVLVNIFYVPGKVIICGLGTVGATLVLALTFGTAYRPAKQVFAEGCGGDWVVTPEHLSGKVPPRQDLP